MADQIPLWEGAILGEKAAHSKVPAMSCTKTAEPIDLPFGLLTWVGRRKHKFNRIHQAAPMPMRAHWLRLANTTEPPACGGDAVLCQITLTV